MGQSGVVTASGRHGRLVASRCPAPRPRWSGWQCLASRAILVPVLQQGLTRTGGVVIIGLYAAFLAFLFKTVLI
jgi:hypothetical protein